MAAERKIRMEVDDLRQQLQSRGQDADRKRRGPDEDTLRKIRRLEDTIAELQKNLAAQKQVRTFAVRAQCLFCNIQFVRYTCIDIYIYRSLRNCGDKFCRVLCGVKLKVLWEICYRCYRSYSNRLQYSVECLVIDNESHWFVIACASSSGVKVAVCMLILLWVFSCPVAAFYCESYFK